MEDKRESKEKNKCVGERINGKRKNGEEDWFRNPKNLGSKNWGK